MGQDVGIHLTTGRPNEYHHVLFLQVGKRVWRRRRRRRRSNDSDMAAQMPGGYMCECSATSRGRIANKREIKSDGYPRLTCSVGQVETGESEGCTQQKKSHMYSGHVTHRQTGPWTLHRAILYKLQPWDSVQRGVGSTTYTVHDAWLGLSLFDEEWRMPWCRNSNSGCRGCRGFTRSKKPRFWAWWMDGGNLEG